jgi:hypothetical protein
VDLTLGGADMPSSVDDIQSKIRALYTSGDHDAIDIPLPLRSAVYGYNAADYLEAARVLSEGDQQQHLRLLMPWYQLMGQALELAMKACLAISGKVPPHTHDLVVLSKQVEAAGFSLGVAHAHALLVHLNHGYFEDLATGDRFVARYGGGGSWAAVPDHARLAIACEALIAQARERNPMLHGTPSDINGEHSAS